VNVAVVTGANGAIGLAIVAGIAKLPDWEVVLVCRDEAKARATEARVKKLLPSAQLRAEAADLSRRSAIEELAARIRGPVHALVNNAAIAPRKRSESPEGIELQLATNVLGYVWLTRALSEKLAQNGRVVNVASYWAGDLDVNDLEFRRRRYDNDTAYRQSKQANRMLTRVWAERLEKQNVRVNACHPGDVRSKLSEDLGFGGHESPEAGARTPVWLATSPSVAGETGGYFANEKRQHCSFAADGDGVLELARALERYG
jgi:NAD(P)-dependent dehydrogenase (short-subunit alcohol dehydrogenase family)